ncbi:MAG: ExeM/NucH family extracellular endonuclease, partial [Myxococcota bacterium]
MNGLTFLIISGEFSPGSIDFAFDLSGNTIRSDGLFAFGASSLTTGTLDVTGDFQIFGSPATYLIVSNFTGSVGDDLDVDNDGQLDAVPFDSVLDAVSIIDGDGNADRNYGTTAVISPDGNNAPAHFFRLPSGSGAFQAGAFGDLSNDTPGAANTGTSPVLTRISAVQGSTPPDGDASNDASPLAGQTVTVEGIVVGDFQESGGADGNLRGFYLQEEDIDADTDPFTSEAIFVFSNNIAVNKGDRVQLTGSVTEFFGLTQIASVTAFTIISANNAPPTATRVVLPAVAAVPNADGDLIADLEQFEGMRVTFPQPLEVTELFQLDQFGELRLAQGGRLFQFTNGSAPSVDGFATHQQEIAARNVVLDDGLTTEYPSIIRYPGGFALGGLTAQNPVRMGDTVAGLTGVLHYSRGRGGSGNEAFRVMPTEEPHFVPNARPSVPEVGGNLKVASFNVLNFFNTVADGSGQCFRNGSFSVGNCRGANSSEELERQLEKLVTAMVALDADIYGLVELENDGVDGDNSSVATLARALTARGTRGCDGGFDYVDLGDRVGEDAIAVGFVFCSSKVQRAPGSQPAVLTDADLPGLGF